VAKNGSNGRMKADDTTIDRLAQQAEESVAEFRERFGEIISKKAEKIDSVYPIDHEKFFGNNQSYGMGTIFREASYFWGSTDKNMGWPELHAGIETDKFSIRFEHLKDHPKARTQTELHIVKGNYGFKVDLDDNLNIKNISDGVSDLEEDIDKQIHQSVSEIWNEFRQELRIDQRIKECAELSREDIAMAKTIQDYKAERGEFPSLPVSLD